MWEGLQGGFLSFRRKLESSVRHSGEGRNPSFVIPAEAGIQFGFFFGFRRCRENRFTSMCGSSAIHGRRFLSFACPKESNQRKDTLASAVTRASCARDYASRLRGSPGAHPCALVERARILRAPFGLFLRLLAAAERGPGGARARQSLPQKRFEPSWPSTTHPLSRSRERARVRAGSWVPSEPRRRANGKAAQSRGRRDGSRRFRLTGHGWPVGRTRSPAANRSLRERRGSEGAVSLWLLLFGQAKRK